MLVIHNERAKTVLFFFFARTVAKRERPERAKSPSSILVGEKKTTARSLPNSLNDPRIRCGNGDERWLFLFSCNDLNEKCVLRGLANSQAQCGHKLL